MKLLHLSWRNLWHRPLPTLLSLFLLASGIATLVVLWLASQQLGERLQQEAKGIDLVVGAKGSPLQLVLSSVYHLDIPTGNISQQDAQRWMHHPMVARAIPLALGDNLGGFRIVGTDPGYLALYQGQLATGRHWQQPMEVVIGAEVARVKHIQLGDTLVGSHGLEAGGELHSHSPYRVVGILQANGSVLDRLILTPVASVWQVHAHEAEEEHEHEADGEHEHEAEASHAQEAEASHADEHHQETHTPTASPASERELTALLLQFRSPLAVATLPREINRQSALQAASPVMEAARLQQLTAQLLQAVQAIAGLLVVAALLSLFATLYQALEQRRGQWALMRMLGASRSKLFGSMVLEGALLSTLGTLLGLLLAHGLLWGLSLWLASTRHVPLPLSAFHPAELYWLALAPAAGIVTALLPAWRASRTSVALTLTQG